MVKKVTPLIGHDCTCESANGKRNSSFLPLSPYVVLAAHNRPSCHQKTWNFHFLSTGLLPILYSYCLEMGRWETACGRWYINIWWTVRGVALLDALRFLLAGQVGIVSVTQWLSYQKHSKRDVRHDTNRISSSLWVLNGFLCSRCCYWGVSAAECAAAAGGHWHITHSFTHNTHTCTSSISRHIHTSWPRNIFGLRSHNKYINAFALHNNTWKWCSYKSLCVIYNIYLKRTIWYCHCPACTLVWCEWH